MSNPQREALIALVANASGWPSKEDWTIGRYHLEQACKSLGVPPEVIGQGRVVMKEALQTGG